MVYKSYILCSPGSARGVIGATKEVNHEATHTNIFRPKPKAKRKESTVFRLALPLLCPIRGFSGVFPNRFYACNVRG